MDVKNIERQIAELTSEEEIDQLLAVAERDGQIGDGKWYTPFGKSLLEATAARRRAVTRPQTTPVPVRVPVRVEPTVAPTAGTQVENQGPDLLEQDVIDAINEYTTAIARAEKIPDVDQLRREFSENTKVSPEQLASIDRMTSERKDEMALAGQIWAMSTEVELDRLLSDLRSNGEIVEEGGAWVGETAKGVTAMREMARKRAKLREAGPASRPRQRQSAARKLG